MSKDGEKRMQQLYACLHRQLSGILILVTICALNALLVYIELLPSPTKWVAKSSSIIVNALSGGEIAANQTTEPEQHQQKAAVTNDSYMIFSAYWDRRPQNSTLELMIFGVTRCRKPNETLPYAIFKNATGDVSSIRQLNHVDTDNLQCMGTYHPGCRFVPSELFRPVPPEWESALRENGVDQNLEVTILADDNRAITLRPTWSAETYDNTLSICVPPIYWYHDWRRILLFVAVWRAQGAAHFYFYFNSGTKEVHRLLKYYERQGYATVLPYPDLPYSEGLDPNWWTFRLAHSMAISDCALRTKSKWAAHVDIDEFILMNDTNVKLVDWLLQQPDDVGELSFTHRQLHFNAYLMEKLRTPSSKIEASDVENALVFPSGRAPKMIFQTRAMRSSSIHWMSRMQKGFKKRDVDTSVAYYGHFRWNMKRSEAGNHTVGPIMTTKRAEETALYIERSIADVFGAHLPHYNGSAIDHMTGVCTENWPSQKTKCMVPLRSCKKQMLPLADWHFERSTNEVWFVL